jgi:glutamyl-tRNA synthetase
MTEPVVTRFAPSPTGFLHIGGARTALFNWLYAKHTGGRMLLRIEDTDRERSTAEAVAAIVNGLTWLGLDWDGEPVSQYASGDRHREIARQLLAEGKAYRCYCTPQELEEMREKARREGGTRLYDGSWRDRDPSEAPPGVEPVIRLRAPLTGETAIDDRVQGRVVWKNENLDDFVLLRSDGSPTYNLSVVVDDRDMGVTHIIRGVDHLTNAARQQQVLQALGWREPVLAHIPLIHGPDGAKLSKRHGALGVEAYRDMGYLPAAMRNYLVRLGWSHGDQEIFSTDEMIALFNLDGIGKSPARFDFAKLENVNGHYLRTSEDAALLAALESLLPHLPAGAEATGELDESTRARLTAAMPVLKERAKTLVELWDGARFIVAHRPLPLDDKAQKLLSEDGRAVLAAVKPLLDGLPQWTAAALEESVKKFAEKKDISLGKIAQPLRAALTGRAVSPGIFDVLAVLGREESLARIADQMQG